ncbi:hypothetical protein HY642_05690 [Candidatus Woesearchaeota archaeon]|nr:hypothetical protein [Candidatus Woesearchaeota archaeon]
MKIPALMLIAMLAVLLPAVMAQLTAKEYALAEEEYAAGFLLPNVNDATQLQLSQGQWGLLNSSWKFPGTAPEKFWYIHSLIWPQLNGSRTFSGDTLAVQPVPSMRATYLAHTQPSQAYETNWSFSPLMFVCSGESCAVERGKSPDDYDGFNPLPGQVLNARYGGPWLVTVPRVKGKSLVIDNWLLKGTGTVLFIDQSGHQPALTLERDGIQIRSGNLYSGWPEQNLSVADKLAPGKYQSTLTIPLAMAPYQTITVKQNFILPRNDPNTPALAEFSFQTGFTPGQPSQLVAVFNDETAVSKVTVEYSSDGADYTTVPVTGTLGGKSARVSAAITVPNPAASLVALRLTAVDSLDNVIVYTLRFAGTRESSVVFALDPDYPATADRGDKGAVMGALKDSAGTALNFLTVKSYMNGQQTGKDLSPQFELNWSIPEDYASAEANFSLVFEGSGAYKQTEYSRTMLVRTFEHDLAVTDMSAEERLVNQTVDVSATVVNLGFFGEENITVRLFANSTAIGNQTYARIAAGDSVQFVSPWTPQKDGVYLLRVRVDPATWETYTVNNEKTLKLSTGNDLAIQVLAPLDEKFTTGKQAALPVRVINYGVRTATQNSLELRVLRNATTVDVLFNRSVSVLLDGRNYTFKAFASGDKASLEWIVDGTTRRMGCTVACLDAGQVTVSGTRQNDGLRVVLGTTESSQTLPLADIASAGTLDAVMSWLPTIPGQKLLVIRLLTAQDIDLSNNYGTLGLYVRPVGPDLRVRTFTAPLALIGGDINLTIELSNIGSEACREVRARVADLATNEVLSEWPASTIPADSTVSKWILFPGVQNRTYRLEARANCQGDIDLSNNNHTSIVRGSGPISHVYAALRSIRPVAQINLTGEPALALAGAQNRINLTLYNDGLVDAANTKLVVAEELNGVVQSIASQDIGVVPHGQSQLVSIPWTPQRPGRVNIVVNVTADRSEKFSASFPALVVRTAPDAEVRLNVLGPVKVGSAQTVIATVKSVGLATARNISVNFTVNNTLVNYTNETFDLVSLAEREIPFQWTPAVQGPHVLKMIVGAANDAFPENNVAVRNESVYELLNSTFYVVNATGDYFPLGIEVRHPAEPPQVEPNVNGPYNALLPTFGADVKLVLATANLSYANVEGRRNMSAALDYSEANVSQQHWLLNYVIGAQVEWSYESVTLDFRRSVPDFVQPEGLSVLTCDLFNMSTHLCMKDWMLLGPAQNSGRDVFTQQTVRGSRAFAIAQRDADNDRMPDWLDDDDDDDGCPDALDPIIGTSTSPSGAKLLINDAEDFSMFCGRKETVNAKLVADGKLLSEFPYDLAAHNLDATRIKVDRTNDGIAIAGLGLIDERKTVYQDVSIDTALVCVKDEEVFNLSQLTTGCNGPDEVLIRCTGATVQDIGCTVENNRFKLTQLRHTTVRVQPSTCVPDWQCTPFSNCTGGSRTRTCTDTRACGITANKPAESESCGQSGGGGGGAGGDTGNRGGGGTTVRPPAARSSEGYTGFITLRLQEPYDSEQVVSISPTNRLTFPFKGNVYTLVVGSITDKVPLNLSPTGTAYLLGAGETATVDLNQDGTSDAVFRILRLNNAVFGLKSAGTAYVAPSVACGDRKCDVREDWRMCPQDCPPHAPTVVCGDGRCDTGENYGSCPSDCQTPVQASYCTDGACDPGETYISCADDCPAPEPSIVCGDNACTGLESYLNCAADCPPPQQTTYVTELPAEVKEPISLYVYIGASLLALIIIVLVAVLLIKKKPKPGIPPTPPKPEVKPAAKAEAKPEAKAAEGREKIIKLAPEELSSEAKKYFDLIKGPVQGMLKEGHKKAEVKKMLLAKHWPEKIVDEIMEQF